MLLSNLKVQKMGVAKNPNRDRQTRSTSGLGQSGGSGRPICSGRSAPGWPGTEGRPGPGRGWSGQSVKFFLNLHLV